MEGIRPDIFTSKVGTPGDPSNLMLDFNRIIAGAGLTEQSLVAIGEQLEEGLSELQAGLDTELEEEPTPISTEVGMSWANPFLPGEMHITPNWDLRVLESIRGDEAWQMIQAANSFNDPPEEGEEYILIKVKAISTHEDNEEHNISSWDFNLTGSNLIEYGNAEVSFPLQLPHSRPWKSGGEACSILTVLAVTAQM